MFQLEILFEPRSRATQLAREMRCPVQTVHSWKRNNAIPVWRRLAVLAALGRMDVTVPPEIVSYLEAEQ